MQNQPFSCQACGITLAPGAQFCTHCGQPVSQPAPTSAAPAPTVQQQGFQDFSGNIPPQPGVWGNQPPPPQGAQPWGAAPPPPGTAQPWGNAPPNNFQNPQQNVVQGRSVGHNNGGAWNSRNATSEGVAGIILGVLAYFLFWFVFAIAAIATGATAIFTALRVRKQGGQQWVAGLVTGIIAVILGIGAVIFDIALLSSM